jgi:hypothetical protein
MWSRSSGARVASADAPNISNISPNRGTAGAPSPRSPVASAAPIGDLRATAASGAEETSHLRDNLAHESAFDVAVTAETSTLAEGFGFGAVPVSLMTNTRRCSVRRAARAAALE